MLAKIASTLPSKLALAALGGALIIGGGATAMAAGHSHHATHETTSSANGKHAHTVGLVGTLKAYDAGAGTITVDGKKASDGDEHSGDSSTGSNSSTSATGTFTIAVNSATRVNGEHAKTLADLAKAIGSKVQVQALDDGKGNLTAWKVTVGGKDEDQQAGHYKGTIGTVDTNASTFTLQPEQGNPLTIHVSPQTSFEGVAGLADLKSGMKAEVRGTQQPDGSIEASKVRAKDAHQGDKGEHEGELEGTVKSVDTTAQTFVVHTEDGHDVTVHVSPQTRFHGQIKSLSDLKPDMKVEVEGATQPDGSVNATKVAAEDQNDQGDDDHGDHGDQGKGHGEGQDD